MSRPRLSPTMRVVLREIVSDPGRGWTDYRSATPRTVRALERRGLIEVFEEGFRTRARPTEAGRVYHEHAYKFSAHADGCHWFVTTAVCECGAVLRQTGERDPNEDGYASLWMIDEDGAPFCSRCEELLDGATPEHTTETFMPDGSAVPA